MATMAWTMNDRVMDGMDRVGNVIGIHDNFWETPMLFSTHKKWLKMQNNPPSKYDLTTKWYSVKVDCGGSIMVPHSRLTQA